MFNESTTHLKSLLIKKNFNFNVFAREQDKSGLTNSSLVLSVHFDITIQFFISNTRFDLTPVSIGVVKILGGYNMGVAGVAKIVFTQEIEENIVMFLCPQKNCQ